MDTKRLYQAKTPITQQPQLQSNRFGPRPFSNPETGKPVSPSPQPVDLQAQIEKGYRFGHNFSRVKVIGEPPTLDSPRFIAERQEVESVGDSPASMFVQGKAFPRFIAERQEVESVGDSPASMFVQRKGIQRNEAKELGETETEETEIQRKCSQCEEKEAENSGSSIQTKLSIGAPGDKYEQEADGMAAKVMAMPAPENEEPIQREMLTEEKKEEEVQTKPLAATITPLVQRETALEEQKEEEEVQTKALSNPTIQRETTPEEPQEEENLPVQAKAESEGSSQTSGNLEIDTPTTGLR